jgi:hypothetical protein
MPNLNSFIFLYANKTHFTSLRPLFRDSSMFLYAAGFSLKGLLSMDSHIPGKMSNVSPCRIVISNPLREGEVAVRNSVASVRDRGIPIHCSLQKQVFEPPFACLASSPLSLCQYQRS